jgi:hypothetical protein
MQGGLVGLMIAAVGIWMVLRRSSGPARIALLTFLALAMVGFPFQNPAALMGVILAAAWAVGPPRSRSSGVPTRIVGLPLATVCLILLAGVPTRIVSEGHFSATHRYLGTGIVDQEAAGLTGLYHANEAYKRTPWRFETRLALFQAAVLSHKRLGLPADDQIEEAWRIAQTASPLNPSLLIARLGYLQRMQRCPDECEVILGLLMATSWRKQEVQRMVNGVIARAQNLGV